MDSTPNTTPKGHTITIRLVILQLSGQVTMRRFSENQFLNFTGVVC